MRCVVGVPPGGAEVVQDDESLLILRDPTAKVVIG
jgi:hypothetical protein